MSTPFFSIIIPVYNKEKYIVETVNSVLNQTFNDFELVIVDDESTDGSIKLIEALDDSRINIVRQKNGGVSSARNHGIREACGAYIAFLDADDLWMPEKLMEDHKVLTKYPELMWKCSGLKLSSGSNKMVDKPYTTSDVIVDAINAISNNLFVWTGTIVIRRSVFDNEELLFNEEYNRSEDREVWYKLACTYSLLGYTPKPMAIYRVDITESLTATAFKNIDFSFIDMENRISNFLIRLDTRRQELFREFLKSYNRKYIVNFWVNSSTKNYELDSFSPFLNDTVLKTMGSLYFLPRFMKKGVRKLIRIFFGKNYC